MRSRKIKGITFNLQQDFNYGRGTSSGNSASSSSIDGGLTNKSVSNNASESRDLSSKGNFYLGYRRFEKKGEVGGVTIIDDYAHHPTEIKATLAAARNFTRGKIWCLFQPHTYTRTLALFDEFADAFEDADKVIFAEIYAAREKNIYKLSSKAVMDRMKERHPGKDVYFMPDFAAMAEFVRNNASAGDVVITMGAGDIYKVADLILG